MLDQTDLAPESDPAATPASRNRQGWDIAVTIIVLMLNATFLAVALFLEVYSVSFVDICPNNDCNQLGTAALTALVAAIVVLAVFIVGAVVSVILLVRKRRAWWVAVGSGVLMVVVFFVGAGIAASALTPLHEHPRSDSASVEQR